MEELLKEICIDENKLEKKIMLQQMYINILNNIKIEKGLHKECVYYRKNGIRKISYVKWDEYDIIICSEFHWS